ncbi:hypothetical protein [Streptomyces sp. GbtcB6]|uniref:hypothetical protein n=1 Tax=Streptomyces sp. GbtcB6 TaxID=2824751 RepID=UPI001C3048E9|nr:hypothetical protein [Streptomyces sp. GbtcB6]
MADEQAIGVALDAYLADRTVADALRAWARDHELIVSVPDTPWRRSGGTGAQLVSLDLLRYSNDRMGAYRQSVIVKVCAKGDYSAEPQRHKAAWEANPEFSKKYLVGQPYDSVVLPDGRSMMFQEANFDVGLTCTLGELSVAYQAAGCRRAFSLILQEWNVPLGFQQKTLNVDEYLKLELRHAMSPGRSAYEWVKNAHLLHGDRYFPHPAAGESSRDLPNPIRIASEFFGLKDFQVTYFAGYSHGDLHLDNLVVSRTVAEGPDLDVMQFIDLSGFAEDAPLARDVVTLALSCVFRSLRDGLEGAQREELVNFLVDGVEGSCPGLPIPLRDTLAEVMYVSSLFLQGGELWHAQYLLSLLAHALVYTSYENVGESGRRWFFYLAARAAESFLALSGI